MTQSKTQTSPAAATVAMIALVAAIAASCHSPGPASRGRTPVKVITNSLGMQLVAIPPGEFLMGAPESEFSSSADERPQHRVRITKPFSMGVYEVTQEQFGSLMPDHVNAFNHEGPSKLPAEQVTWISAMEFCRRLSALPAEKNAGRGYRLPTEAEWEYACRAGTTTTFHFGDTLSGAQAHFRGDEPYGDVPRGSFAPRSTVVGLFPPNTFGLYDMHGNVWEWCFDRYDVDYYKRSSVDDPRGAAVGFDRVIRGGGWYSDGRDCRSAFRNSDKPGGIFYVLGLRVVMVPAGSEIFDEAGTPEPEIASPTPASTTNPEARGVERSGEASADEQSAGEDWPRWRGPRGDGTWRAPELPEKWPDAGPKRLWRQPLGKGYSGIAATGRRVYTLDRQTEPEEIERILCFDAATGDLAWSHRYSVTYGDLAYGIGPRSTPTLAAGRVYTTGAVGHVHCLIAETGQPVWKKNLAKDFNATIPLWGFATSPFLYNDLIILHAGAKPDGCMLALNKFTGDEEWRSVSDPAGYATPTLIDNSGVPQLVCWTPENVHGLNPQTGSVYWSVPFKVEHGTSIAKPIFTDGTVVVSGYWDGSRAIRLGPTPANAELVWEDRRNLRGLMAQALVRGGYGYLLDKRAGLTCFEVRTGKKIWDDDNRATPKGRNPQSTIVWTGDGDRVLILNSEGALILARLNPKGYEEQSRANVIGPTWAHPGYAGDRVFVRDNSEIIAYSLLEGSSE